VNRTRVELEATGPDFALDRLLDMRLRTRNAIHAIADQVRIGMVEEEAKEMARQALSDLGLRRGWHHIIVRFGPNTTKNFGTPSETGVTLGENDVFFIDIGPVDNGYEGDGGDTFVVGCDQEHHKAKHDAKAIWDEIRDVWFTSQLTGRQLYGRAEDAAARCGWKLNLDLSGHRLSDFPHAAHYDGPLAEVDFRPSPILWVLEIAIIHPVRPFGAFYEDLLLPDQAV
jgi:methionyl aminopeptidase